MAGEKKKKIDCPYFIRDWALHEDKLFGSRINFFILAESIFFAAYATLFSTQMRIAVILGIAGIALIIIWLYLSWYQIYTTMRPIKEILARNIPEYSDILQIRSRLIGPNHTLGFIFPAILLLTWIIILLPRVGDVLTERRETMYFFVTILSAAVTGIIGYFVGSIKAFREAKQKAYVQLLPPIIKMAYRSGKSDEGELCEALCKLWLYGSKTVTRKMDHALYVAHDPPNRGDISEALKAAIVEMRKDIQLNPLQRLKEDEVRHIFTKIHKTNN